MDVDNLLLSMKIITENTKMIQSDINKLESDISTLQSTGVNVNVSNQVVANSNNPVSSGAVYTYVNQNLTTGGVTMAASFDTANNTDAVSGKLVNDYLVGNNYVTSINPSYDATTGQVLTVNDQGGVDWATPVTELPPTTSALSGQVLSLNANKNLYWNTPSPLPEFFRFVATVDQEDITVTNFNGTPVPYWSISSGSSPVTLNGGAAFVAPYDGMYNVNLSLAIINSTLTASDKYILYIYKVIPNNYYAIQDAIKTAVQTYNFTTAVYDDTYTVSGATSFPLGGQTNANLVVDTGGTIPDNSDVAFNGMLGNATSYISLNDHNSYFSGINSLNEFSIEMNFKILSGSPYLFTMYSSSRWEVQLTAASGSLEYLLSWRRGADTPLFGYATIQIPDRTSFHHLILVFKSTGVTIYLNGAEYTPVQYDPIGFGLNTITSIHLGRHNLYTDTGEERFRSFRFYESAVSVDEAFQLFANQWARFSQEFTPDGNPTYTINSDLGVGLTTGDELHVSLGGYASVGGRQYTLSSGAESRITVKLNMIDNQNSPVYVLAADNSNQVVWAAAPNSNEYFYATASHGNDAFQLGQVGVYSNWTQKEASDNSMFSNNRNVFTVQRAGKYRIKVDATVLNSSIGSGASAYVQIGRVYPLTSGNVPQVYTNAISATPTASYDFRKATVSSTNNPSIPNVFTNVVQATRSYDFRTVQTLTGSSPYTLAYTTPSGTNVQASNTGIQLHVDSGPTPTFDSRDGYNGTTAHYLSIPGTDVPLSSSSHPHQFSLEFYVKFGNTQGNNHYLYSNKFPGSYNNNPPYENFNLLGIYYNSNAGGIAIEGTNDTGPGTYYTFQTFINAYDIRIDETRFYHIVLTYGATYVSGVYQSSGEIRVYIDGNLKASTTNTITNLGAASIVHIGRDFNGNNDNGPESLRFFRYYNSELTAANVANLYLAHRQDPYYRSLTFEAGNADVDSSNTATLYADESNLFPSDPNTTTGLTGTTGSWIQLDPADLVLPSTGGFTIEFFGKWKTGTMEDALFAMFDSDDTMNLPIPSAPGSMRKNYFEIKRDVVSGSTLQIAYSNPVSGSISRSYSNIPQDTLIHLVVVVSQTADPILYINGEVRTTSSSSGSTTSFPGGQRDYAIIGRSATTTSGSSYFSHTEEVRFLRFFNQIISPDDVSVLNKVAVSGFYDLDEKRKYIQYTDENIELERIYSLNQGEQMGFAQKVESMLAGQTHGVNASVLIQSVD